MPRETDNNRQISKSTRRYELEGRAIRKTEQIGGNVHVSLRATRNHWEVFSRMIESALLLIGPLWGPMENRLLGTEERGC